MPDLPRLDIETLNKWLTAGASVAVIIGVLTAIYGAVVAIQTLEQTQGAASATLVLTLRDPAPLGLDKGKGRGAKGAGPSHREQGNG